MNNDITIHESTHTASEFLKVLEDAVSRPEKYNSVGITEYNAIDSEATESISLSLPIADRISEIAGAYSRGHKVTFYKVPERVAKVPDAPVFWVRLKDYVDPNRMRLVTSIATKRMCMGDEYIEVADLLRYEWSPDRKTWFNFYGEKV